MDLDFQTVRALSSPTRIKILDRVMEGEATPTSLSRDLEKSKSTVASHLDTLLDAELVEKEDVEGRRRVVYSPTSKAEDIVSGKEKRVKFSLTSSIISGIAGLMLLGYSQLGFMAQSAGAKIQTNSAELSADTATATEAGATAAESSGLVDPATAVLAASLFFISVSVFSLVYGLVMRRLGE